MRLPQPIARLPRGAALLLLLAAVLSPPAARATTVLECDLDTLRRHAGTVFHGLCVERREITNGVPVPLTESRFRVLEAAKGCRDKAGKTVRTVVVRHVGTRRAQIRPDGTKVPPLRLGVPEYEPGREYVLFLTRESKIGLCAPVGLGQGSFGVLRRGKIRTVQNSRANAGLLPARAGTSEDRTANPKRRALVETARAEGRQLRLETLLELCRDEEGE